MAICANNNKELDENGEGRCSVPMWIDGVPAGFCNKVAYGKPLPYETIVVGNRKVRVGAGYDGYVPFLACPEHGGPEKESKNPNKKT